MSKAFSAAFHRLDYRCRPESGGVEADEDEVEVLRAACSVSLMAVGVSFATVTVQILMTALMLCSQIFPPYR